MIVPERIYDENLPHRAVSVYCYLCGRADKKGECFPSVRTVAEDLHISTARRRVHGGRSSSLYKIKI